MLFRSQGGRTADRGSAPPRPAPYPPGHVADRPSPATVAVTVQFELNGRQVDLDDDGALVDCARRLGPRLVVTLGSRGAAVVGSEGAVTRVPAGRATAIDTTGAGDAFLGAFGYGLAAGMDELTAVRLGIACASDSVTRPGTQSSFATREKAATIVAAVLAAS